MNTPTNPKEFMFIPADAEFPEVDYTADDLMVETGSDAMYNAYTAISVKKSIPATKLSAKDMFMMDRELRMLGYDNYFERQK